MANIFKPKRSSTAAKVPTTTDLASGEIGVNMADQKIWINNGTSVVQVGAGKLSGHADVTLTSLTSGQTLQWNGTAWVNVTGGSGAVTAVTATAPVASSGGTAPVISLASAYGDTQNPFASKTANYVLAAPNGAAGAPTFRALVAADIPTLNQNTTGSAGSVAWTNVSGRPTAVSSFTNDSGYITSSSLSSYLPLGGGTMTGTMVTKTNSGGAITASNDTGAFSVRGDGTNAASFSFHRPGIYAVNFGLDTDNVLKVGGWSMGAASYAILHAGNYNSFSPTLTGTGASGTWGISISGNAATATSATTAGSITSQANSATITASSGVNASQIVQRDANGYIYANYINHNTSETENPTINSIFVSNGDGWTRKASQAHFISQLGLAQQVASGCVMENNQTISANYTMTSGKNGTSAGPITIATGVTVTIPTGSNWVIV